MHLQLVQFPQSVDHAGQTAVIYITAVALLLMVTFIAAAVYIWRRRRWGTSMPVTGCIHDYISRVQGFI